MLDHVDDGVVAQVQAESAKQESVGQARQLAFHKGIKPGIPHHRTAGATLAGMTTTPQAATWTTAARRHRFAAFLVDNLILLVANALIGLMLKPPVQPRADEPGYLTTLLNPYADADWPLQVAITVVGAAYFWVQHALWGQTLGKRLYRLKVVSAATGAMPARRQIGIRTLVHPLLGSAVPYLGSVLYLVDALWIFGDPRRRCLHDIVAGTVVVDVSAPGTKASGTSGFLTGLVVVLAASAAFALITTLLAA
ncbi:RDD family protein [Microbispora hainanensis]|uniref:RDD family protein n=1 Tax=Microbispora hainanensis TaxID=568844 RepID=UPI00324AC651